MGRFTNQLPEAYGDEEDGQSSDHACDPRRQFPVLNPGKEVILEGRMIPEAPSSFFRKPLLPGHLLQAVG